MGATDDFPQLEISWPQVGAENALLQIPSFVERYPLGSRGESAFRRGRTRGLIKENKDPVGDVGKSRECSFPLDGKAYLLPDALETVQFASDNESNFLKFFWGNQKGKLRRMAARCSRAPKEWWTSLTGDQRKVQGRVGLPLLAHFLGVLKMVRQAW